MASSATASTSTTGVLLEAERTTQSVQAYYGETLKTSADLKTSACCVATPPPQRIRDILAHVPAEVSERFYGCGSPLPLGITDLTVVDLGRCVTLRQPLASH